MAVTSMKCPSCGAGVDPPADVHAFTCDYCGNQVRVMRTVAQEGVLSPERVTVSGAPADPEAARRAAKRVTLFVTIITLMVSAWIGISALSMISKVQETTARATQLATSAIPSLGAGESLLWDDVGGDPLALEVGERPAFLGRVRTMPADELFFVAVAADGEVLYRTGPFGTYGDGYRSTFAAVSGDRLAISDANAKLHLADATTGAILKTLDLSDRVKTLCGVPDGSGFWAEQVDKRAYAVDPKSGELTEAPRPEPCVSGEARWGLIPDQTQRQELRRLSKKLENFAASRYLEDGPRRIIAGHRSPGTP